MNQKIEEMKYWNIKEWEKYLKFFGGKIMEVEMLKNRWRMVVGTNVRSGFGSKNQTGITINLPLVK